MRTPKIAHPKVFISYAWTSDIYISKVASFAAELQNIGIEVLFDKVASVKKRRLFRKIFITKLRKQSLSLSFSKKVKTEKYINLLILDQHILLICVIPKSMMSNFSY